MRNKFSGAFLSSFQNVISMFGISNIVLTDEKELDSHLNVSGVVCIIGIVGDVQGNVIFSMNEDCGKMLASYMMGGMEIAEFDEMTQSAVSELGNMLAANATMTLAEADVRADISTPTLMRGIFTVTASYDHVTCLAMDINGHSFDILISLESKN